jgi:aminomuconate-semialdehyde/2-hydroxymuconate-6-semialdehyde dehydrogenase
LNTPELKLLALLAALPQVSKLPKTAAPLFKKLSLELGGKNPNLIFADCNYKKMLETTVRSSFANQGQICLCGSRIFVERSLYHQFKADFIKKVRQLKVGHPNQPDSNIGALVSKSHLEKVKSYIQIAKDEGGVILWGGNEVKVKGFENGYYLEPTVIEVPTDECRVNQEEIFGPVVTLMPFDTEKDALDMANKVKYGLSATIWTNNLNRAMRMTQDIQAGVIWVNTWMLRDLRTPFGGIKASGVGREGGFEALRFFTEPKNICIHY